MCIRDRVCDGWHSYTDESGNKFCNYRFIKNNDGTFSVLIKFADDYIPVSYTHLDVYKRQHLLMHHRYSMLQRPVISSVRAMNTPGH